MLLTGIFLTAVFILSYLTLAFASIIYATIKMCMPGVSKQAAAIVWKRHVLSTIVFIATNLYTWLNILYMFNKEYRDKYGDVNVDDTFVLVFKLVFACQGFVVPLTRITEPDFFKVLKNELNCRNKQANNIDVEKTIIARGVDMAR